MERVVYLSLGSNLGDRLGYIQEAISLISSECGAIIQTSNFYETEPLGFVSDDQFINLCIQISTELSPIELLERTQQIETAVGRLKKSQGFYASRKIDIDIIFFDDLIIEEKKLTIPHQKFQDRKFVLQPLNDIASNFVDPRSKYSVNELLNSCNDMSTLSILKKSGEDQ